MRKNIQREKKKDFRHSKHGTSKNTDNNRIRHMLNTNDLMDGRRNF